MINLSLNIGSAIPGTDTKYVIHNSSCKFLPLIHSGKSGGWSFIRRYVKTIRCQGFHITAHHGPCKRLTLVPASKPYTHRTRQQYGPCIWNEAPVGHQGKYLSHRNTTSSRKPMKVYEMHGTYEARKRTIFTDTYELAVPVTSCPPL